MLFKLPLCSALLVLVLSAASAPAWGQTFPGATWSTQTPAQAGLDPAKLADFQAEIGGSGPGVVIKDGHLVYSWGPQSDHWVWASASKAMFSTLLFFAIEEGLVSSVDELISTWGWSLSVPDQTMTFRQLANMVSGYGLPEGPGSHWGYNDYAVNLYVLTLLEEVYGIDASDPAAVQTLFTDATRLGPLQFEDGLMFANNGGVPRLYATPRDYARVGWLWMNGGNWDGTQILPQSYFDDYMVSGVPASHPQTSGGLNDYLSVGSYGGDTNQTVLGPGEFGFMWWFNDQQSWPDAPADTFMVNGRWNQMVMVMIPSRGIVAAWVDGVETNSNSFDGPMNDILAELSASVLNPVPGPPFAALVGTGVLMGLAGVWRARRSRR